MVSETCPAIIRKDKLLSAHQTTVELLPGSYLDPVSDLKLHEKMTANIQNLPRIQKGRIYPIGFWWLLEVNEKIQDLLMIEACLLYRDPSCQSSS